VKLRGLVCGAALLIGAVAPVLATDDDGGWRSADRPSRDDGHRRYDDGPDGGPHDGYGPDGGAERFAPHDEHGHGPHDGHGPHRDRVILHDDGAATRPYWGTTQPYWGPTQPLREKPPRDWRDPQRAGSVQDVPIHRGGSRRGGHHER
jgi:hypothetical protein